MQPNLVGMQLCGGEYKIIEQIAQGGMATVYKAYSQSLDSIVAVKVLAPELAADPDFRERFHAEATSIEQGLHHPNIIEVKRHGEEQGICYIAMRYVPGGTLKELLKELGGTMDLSSAARLIAQVASALNHANESGYLHLDVKPANILLGNAEWPLLSDFGIIRIMGESRPEDQFIAGTPPYMSPEQWLAQDLDGRADEYALSIMFYQMVTGRLPFSGDANELREKHLNQEPPRPREVNPGIPGPVEEVILRGMAKSREERFATVGEFGEALVESVERSRGMQLETKQAIVSASPALVALFALGAIFAPILVGLADPDQQVIGRLSLKWPIALVLASIQVGLLLGIRWHLIGMLTRFVGSLLDVVDRFTRTGVRLGTDAQGPLRIKAWRNSAVAATEGLVNVAYLFIVYQIIGNPIIETISPFLGYGRTGWVALGLAGLVLLAAALIVLKLYHDGGPIIAVVALTLCWGLISTIPIGDVEVSNNVPLQWIAKLAIGAAVLVVLFAVRGSVQRGVREVAVPLFEQPMGQLMRGRTSEEVVASRKAMEQTSDGLVNVAYLIVGYPIIVPPLRQVLDGYMRNQDTLIAVAITLVVVVMVILMVNTLRITGGVIPAALALLVCAPLLIGLPWWEEQLQGNDFLKRAAGIAVALGVLLIFVSIRKQVQALARGTLVPALDVQIGSLIHAKTEEEAAARRRSLERVSDTAVNLIYLVAGYFIVIRPLAGAFSAEHLGWVGALINVLYLLVVLLVLVRFVQGALPQLRKGPAVATT